MDPTRNQAWFEAAYHDHEHSVRQYAVRRVGLDEADSVVSAVFSSLWRHRTDAPESLLPWLFGVAANLPAAGAPQPGPALRADLPLPGVHQMLAQSPAAQAELLRLAHWEQLDRRDIATVLGSTSAAVAARLRRAERLAADQLAAGIGSSNPAATVTELLRAADPAAELAATPTEVLDARAELLARSPAHSPGPLPPPRPRRWWPVVLLVSVALVAAAAFGNRERLVFLISDRADWADEVLALAAESAADPDRRPDQYWRITERGIEADLVDRQPVGGYAVVIDQVTYLSTDRTRPICFDSRGGGEVVDSFGAPRRPPSPQRVGVTCYAGDNALFWRSELPVEAARLGRLLEQRVWGPAPVEEQTLAQASVLLGTGYLTAEQRAAVFEYLVGVPGLEVIHPRIVAGDRAGLGIGISDPQTEHLAFLVIDGDTGELLGTGWPGDHRHFVVRVFRDVVDELPADIVELACQRASDPSGPLVCPR